MRCDAGQVKRIDVLPDDVLLEIFDFFVNLRLRPLYLGKTGVEEWQLLVHVCRRWRNLVFGSPRRLDLQLYCTPETTGDRLNIWPALPLFNEGDMNLSDAGTDNVIAALGQSHRVCQVFLSELAGWQLEKVLAPMQVPFPELTDLQLFSNDETPPPPVIPDSILGGSAPRLRNFTLYGIPFPGLPNLLLSATHLVTLRLYDIPYFGYISPAAMVASLSVLSSLEVLSLEFRSPQSQQGQSLSPPKRSILPALDTFHFKGTTEYLEDLVSGIDTPQIKSFYITFLNQIDFDTSRLAQFIDRSPILRGHDEACLQFNNFFASVALLTQSRTIIKIRIQCEELDRQLSSVARVCKSFSPSLSTVEDLYIKRLLDFSLQVWNNDAIENTLWLPLLLQFTAVKNLYLSNEFGPGIAAALRELVGGRITEVLPSLQNIFVEELESSVPLQENIRQFVATRQLSDHPITISVWDRF